MKAKSKTVTVRLDNATLSEIDQACLEYNETKNAMIGYLIERGLHVYRNYKKRDQVCTNILQVLELKQTSTNGSRDC
jgi:hypothetical protein